jgi:hypothetical protein
MPEVLLGAGSWHLAAGNERAPTQAQQAAGPLEAVLCQTGKTQKRFSARRITVGYIIAAKCHSPLPTLHLQSGLLF